MSRILLLLLILLIAIPAIAVGLNKLARRYWHDVVQTQTEIDRLRP